MQPDQMNDDARPTTPSWLRQALCLHHWAPPTRHPAFGPGFLSSTCVKCGRIRNGHAIIRRAPTPFLNGLAPIERTQLAR